jgi:Putative amidase domain
VLLRASRTPRMMQRTYSRKAAADYARKWAMTDNPAYGRIEPNDCTNFVSQALSEGGWTMVGGSVLDRKDKNVWWFGKSVWTKASYSWGGAQNLYDFMKASGRGTDATKPMDLEVGDILQMDMGPGHYNAGRIGHSMVVTDKKNNDLYLSYHEDHHLDEPLSAISGRYPSAVWYPWQPS